MSRKFVDCRETPSDANCTLAIYGEADEVVQAAVDHMVNAHGHTAPKEELADLVRAEMKDASGTA